MKSLKALTAHLDSLQLTSKDYFDSWVEKGTLEYSGATITDGVEQVNLLMRLPYLAVLSWENWSGDAYRLFFEVMKWLAQHDHDFDRFGMPEFTSVVSDDNLADVQIEIRFEDHIYESGGEMVDEPTPSVVDAVTVREA